MRASTVSRKIIYLINVLQVNGQHLLLAIRYPLLREYQNKQNRVKYPLTRTSCCIYLRVFVLPGVELSSSSPISAKPRVKSDSLLAKVVKKLVIFSGDITIRSYIT